MPPALNELLSQHFHTTLFVATLLEGLGLPVPAEILFIPAVVLVHQGVASLGSMITVAVAGNMVGALLGFGLAYRGGERLIGRLTRRVGMKPGAMQEVAGFFERYGAATIFFARFVGFIRAATIYSAGAARVAPWRFAGYTLAAAIIWNAGWAYMAYRFGRGLHALAQRGAGWAVALVALLLVGGGLLLWRKRRRTADS